MNILNRLLLIVLVPAAAIWGIATYASLRSYQSLNHSIQRASVESASALMDEVNRFVGSKVQEWDAFTRQALILDSLMASNRQFDENSEREKEIDEIDAAWATMDRHNPRYREISSGPLAVDLANTVAAHITAQGNLRYGEVFITNRYGANVAQSSPTSDYRQSDEQWWQKAMADGTYVSDMHHDSSAGINSIDLCVRIDDAHAQPLGVIKVVMDIDEVIQLVRSRSEQLNQSVASSYVLFSKSGQVICNTESGFTDAEAASSILTSQQHPGDQVQITRRVDGGGGELLDRLSVVVRSRAMESAVDLGWTLVLVQDAEELLAPATDLRHRITVLAALSTCVALLIAGGSALSLSRRIRRLADTAKEYGEGSEEFHLYDPYPDEIGRLTASFRRMAERLNDNMRRLRQRSQLIEEQRDALAGEIEQRRVAQRGLVEQKERLRLALTAAQAGTWSWDLATNALDFDERMLALIGAAAGKNEWAYGDWLALVHEEDRERVEAMIREAIEGSAAYDYEYRLESVQKGCVTLRTQGVVDRDPDGTPTRVIGVCVDVTELTKAMSDLKEEIRERKLLETKLVQANKLKAMGQLAAGIAHEINTPTQYISDNTRFIRDEFEVVLRVLDRYAAQIDNQFADRSWDEQMQEIRGALEELDFAFIREEIPNAVQQSLEGLERIADVVRAMKQFSQPAGGDKQLADLNAAIQASVTVCQSHWVTAAQLTLELSPDLADTPCLLAEFNQVIYHLVSNAADSVRERYNCDPDHGRITISTRAVDAWVEVRVEDNGNGMTQDILEHIFDPFFTTKEVGSGSGQGLTICHDAIVNLHSGELLCASEPGRGTVFTIRLPLDDSVSLQEAA